ncbi:hypothetical protein IM816_10915 [Luteibacter flocculans]|uniref:Teneurin-like YD-shell domain-containing protein n=1 Tax=Luteibacter flocculans TaxID=2780091 RepID=A0ABY4T2Z0_9GAMM|nr:RHS repeat-associated core domain-containing protein [Luteibacter flocculans]URL57166.1 hypothetical protein IM816_10915 [Luteibacter flocculans]
MHFGESHNQMGKDPCDYESDAIFNSLTEKRNNVQPRTGLFEACVPLPRIVGNLGFGPAIDMSLFYSPVVNNASALGDGWSFAFTTYHEKSGKLTLHTGEVLSVESKKDLKTASVIVRWKSDGAIEVEYKDGRVETLRSQPKSGIWVPVRLTTDGCRYVALSWIVVPQGVDYAVEYQIRLTGIRNDMPVHAADPAPVRAEAARQLVSLEYEPDWAPSLVLITFWFGSDDELTYVLTIENVALRAITPPEGEAFNCELTYIDDDVCGWLLNSIRTFDGLTEQVEYVPETRTFEEDSKLNYLPCVSRYTVTPRAGGKPMVTTYAYSQNEKDPSAAYTTTVTEVATSGGRKTVYVYDSSYTMVSETTTRGVSTLERKFKSTSVGFYSTKKNQFPEAPGPCSARTTETCFSRSGVSRTEYSNSYFEGSTLKFIHSKCNKTYFDYAPEGDFLDAYLVEERTLADDYLSSGKSMPVEDDVKKLNADLTMRQVGRESRHSAVDGLNRKKVVYVRTKLCAGDSAICQETDYFSDGYRRGLVKQVVQGLEVGYSLGSDVSSTAYEYSLNGTSMTITTTCSRGGESRSTSKSVSILSGRCLSEVDACGNTTIYAFDRAGRLSSRTACKGTAYSEVTNYTYPVLGRMEITEADGRKRAAESDGRDNIIKEEVYEGGAWNTVSSVEYDELGRRATITSFDAAGKVAIKEVCSFGYDDWNEESRRTYSDGRVEFDEFDPIFLVRDEWEGKQTDKHRKRTFYRPDDQVACIRWLDAEGRAFMGEAYSYSEGRLSGVVTGHDDGGEEVATEYDGLGRVTAVRRRLREKCPISAAPFPITGGGDVSKREWWDGELKPSSKRLEHIVAYEYRAGDFLNPEPVSVAFFDAGEDWDRFSAGKSIDFQDTGFPKSPNPSADYVLRISERELDVWGRVTSITRAGVRERMTYEGVAPAPRTITRADGTRLTYDYIKELGYRTSKVSGSDGNGSKSRSLSYVHGATRQSTVKEGATELAFNHDLNEWPTTEKVTLASGSVREIRAVRSLGGRILSEVDATGGQVTYTYNAAGQRTSTQRGTDIKTTHAYNAASMLSLEEVSYAGEKAQVAYAYDAMYREVSRTFTLPGTTVLTLKREYDARSRLLSMRLTNGVKELASKTFTYDKFDRLGGCTTAGLWKPLNPKGKPIDSQAFTYDGLGNVVMCVTRFGTATCSSKYSYDASGCRLVGVTHDHDDYMVGGKRSVELTYDACGRLTRDAQGKTYDYDWMGRLIRAGSRYYTYDGMDRLASSGAATDQRQLVFDGMDLRGEHGQGDAGRYFYAGSAACSIQRVKLGSVDRTLFELCDTDGTVLVTYDRTAKTFKHHAYTAYGEHSSDETDSLLGFQGAYRDVDGATDRYPLGQGYRWYAPGHMQFNAPDSESPYGVGGMHPYGYCAGDPINYQDPSGHAFGWLKSALQWAGDAINTVHSYTPVGMLMARIQQRGPDWLNKTVKIGEALAWGVVGVAGTVFTGGTSLVLVSIAVTLAVASAGIGIAAIIVSDSDPATASTLNWIAFGMSVGSAAAGLRAGLGKVGALTRNGNRWTQSVAKDTTTVAARNAAKTARTQVLSGDVGRATVELTLGSLPSLGEDSVTKKSQPSRSSLWAAAPAAGAATSANARLLVSLKPYGSEVVGAMIDGVGSALGSAGVFDDQATAKALADADGTVGVPVQSLGGQYDLGTSLAGRMRSRTSRLRFR